MTRFSFWFCLLHAVLLLQGYSICPKQKKVIKGSNYMEVAIKYNYYEPDFLADDQQHALVKPKSKIVQIIRKKTNKVVDGDEEGLADGNESEAYAGLNVTVSDSTLVDHVKGLLTDIPFETKS